MGFKPRHLGCGIVAACIILAVFGIQSVYSKAAKDSSDITFEDLQPVKSDDSLLSTNLRSKRSIIDELDDENDDDDLNELDQLLEIENSDDVTLVETEDDHWLTKGINRIKRSLNSMIGGEEANQQQPQKKSKRRLKKANEKLVAPKNSTKSKRHKKNPHNKNAQDQGVQKLKKKQVKKEKSAKKSLQLKSLENPRRRRQHYNNIESDDEDDLDGSGSGDPSDVPHFYRLKLTVSEVWDNNFQNRDSDEFKIFASEFSDTLTQFISQTLHFITIVRANVVDIKQRDTFIIYVSVDLEFSDSINTYEFVNRFKQVIDGSARIGGYAVNSTNLAVTEVGEHDPVEEQEYSEQHESDNHVPQGGNGLDEESDIELDETENGEDYEDPVTGSEDEYGPTDEEEPIDEEEDPEAPTDDEGEHPQERNLEDPEAPTDYDGTDPQERNFDDIEDHDHQHHEEPFETNDIHQQPPPIDQEDELELEIKPRVNLDHETEIEKIHPTLNVSDNQTITDCAEGEKLCKSGTQCYAVSSECDGFPDCEDVSDEADCTRQPDDQTNETELICSDDEFKCIQGNDYVCLPNDFICDSIPQCDNGEDEQKDCDRIEEGEDDDTEIECHEDEFACHDGVQCVPKTQKCNGASDCRDGSDELNCQEPEIIQRVPEQQAPPRIDPPAREVPSERCRGDDQVPCGNSDVFICEVQKCDGNPDCPDGEDEENCENEEQEIPEGCQSNEFECDGNRCIPVEYKCNNQRDCDDGTDEESCPPPEAHGRARCFSAGAKKL